MSSNGEKQNKVYHALKKYIEKVKQSVGSPDLSLQPLKELPPDAFSDQEITIGLYNVATGDRRLFQVMERFAPGTKLVAHENVHGDQPVYKVYVRWNYETGKQKKKRGHHNNYYVDTLPPSSSSSSSSCLSLTNWLWLYGVGALGVVAAAAWTTTKSDWGWLF